MTPSVISIGIGLSLTLWDLLLYLGHRLREDMAKSPSLMEELREWLERERSGYLETFYFVAITKRAVSPSITALVRSHLRATSLN
jgi:hypothetical protein